MHLQRLFQTHTHEKLTAILFGASVIILGIAAAIAYNGLAGLTSPLIANYDIFHGVNLIGSKVLIYNVIGIAFAIICINYLISRAMLSRSIFLAYFVAVGTVIVSLVVLIGVSVIVRFNV